MGRAHVLIGRDPSKAVLPILFWTAGADKSRWFVLTLLSLLDLPHQPYFTWKKELNLGPFSESKIYILRGYYTHDMNNVQSLFDILQWLSCTYLYICVCISDTYLKCLYTDTLTQLGPCVLDDWSEYLVQTSMCQTKCTRAFQGISWWSLQLPETHGWQHSSRPREIVGNPEMEISIHGSIPKIMLHNGKSERSMDDFGILPF